MTERKVTGTYGKQVTVHQNGKVEVHGIDFGPKLTYWGESPGVLVLKAGGHTAWSGIGQTAYHGTSFVVYKIVDKIPSTDGKRTIYNVEPIADIDLR